MICTNKTTKRGSNEVYQTTTDPVPKGKTKGLHLIAAYLPAEGIVLAQMPVEKKENELVVAPKLLQKLDLKRRIVIGDAMFTQRNLSVQIKHHSNHFSGSGNGVI